MVLFQPLLTAGWVPEATAMVSVHIGSSGADSVQRLQNIQYGINYSIVVVKECT